MKNKILKILGFLVLNFSLVSSLQAINYQVNDCFPDEYIDKINEIGIDINQNIDLDIPLTKFNQAIIIQIGDLNQAHQYQYGIFDIALIYQEGNLNYAYQKQQGNHNQAYIIEKGSNNKAYQYQYNDYNTGIIVLIGNGNSAFQYQPGHSTNIIIHQGNGAIIYQYD